MGVYALSYVNVLTDCQLTRTDINGLSRTSEKEAFSRLHTYASGGGGRVVEHGANSNAPPSP